VRNDAASATENISDITQSYSLLELKQGQIKHQTYHHHNTTLTMPYKPTKQSKKPRDYDAESGKNRTKGKKKTPLPPPPESESEPEASDTEPEVESDYEIEIKDTHRQKSTKARPRKVKAQQDTENATHGDEDEGPSATIAPADDFLVAIAYRQGTSALQHETRSFYVPDCYALFSAAFYMCELLTANSLVHEVDPSFMSLTLYLYVAHLFYFQILRVRDVVGELTREERRCLRHYENIGPAESWPIPTPLIAIIRSLGLVQPPSKYYGKIIPKLPTFAGFTAGHSLANIHAVTSIARVPVIPAMQQFLHNFGSGAADIHDGTLYPLANPQLTPGAAGPPVVPPNTFLGLTDSRRNSHIQTLFFSSGWNRPTETSEPLLNYPYAQKRALIARMRVPTIGETATITGLESFLGFRDGQSKAWMKKLLSSGSTACRFFPGSSNLSAIATTVQEEIPTIINWTTAVARTSRDHEWFRGRNLWTYSFNGKVNTEQSGYLYKVAASASPNANFSANILPIADVPAVTHSAERDGPYFDNPAGAVSVPLTLIESHAQPDPIRNMLTLMDENLYDNLGGRARR
jgi:hypothetical protein